MKANGARRGAAFLLTTTVLVAVGGPMTFERHAYAQIASRQAYDFNIPSKPVRQSLNDIGRITGLSVVFSETSAASVAGRPVSGSLTASEALATLLSGTGLTYRFTNANTVTITNRVAAAHDAPAEDGSLVLDTINVAGGGGATAQAVYSEPRSSVYVSGEQLERYGTISPGDVLKGQPGVQVGDSRNGGGVDVNIRGIQGQSRVAVTVDGTQQALDVYRGYAGTQQRSYIDADLISDVTIRKGPGLTPAAAGAIGGTVEMTTLRVEDILLPGRNYGVRLKGELWDNGVKPPHRQTTISDSSDLYAEPRSKRPNIFDSDAKAGSAAFAFTSDYLDFVAAYARRSQGNYFPGKHGREKYRTFDEYGYEQNTVASSYMAGEEVLNSSADTESVLLKATIRPTDEQALELSYRHFDGSFGEIMPSDIYRSDTAGIYQYPTGDMVINSASARYTFNPEENDLVDLKANLWLTDARSDQLSGAFYGPASQTFFTDRSWVRMDNLRVGGDIANRSDFDTGIGEFSLNLGGSFQYEDIGPQKDVLITEHDRNMNKVLRDGYRTMGSFSGQLDYRPVDNLQIWAGGRYSAFRSRDRNSVSTPRREDLYGRWVRAYREDEWGGFMYWLPDENGEFTDATDPRLNNGIVASNTNNPFDGIPFDEYGSVGTEVYDPQTTSIVVGFDHSQPLSSRDGGFEPAFGINYEIVPQTFLYTTYTEGLRMPSLFETTAGTHQMTPVAGLRPERSRSWEAGASTTLDGMVMDGDRASFKLAYFDTNIKDYITRYYDPTTNGLMVFSNAESYKANGLEFQSRYDSGRLFADLSATYYFRTETCDPAFAAHLRSTSSPWQPREDTPDCTPGSFMGSFTNTQNPPKYAINLTLGSRFFEEKLVVGGRMTYTSGPTEELDKPWQTGATTPQVLYHPVAVFDAFLSYKLREGAVLNASIENITDRYYLDPLAQSFMPAPGRTFRAGVAVKF